MPVQLMHLNEQLLNLKVVYETAVLNNISLSEIKKINNQIKDIEQQIEARKEYIKRNQSAN